MAGVETTKSVIKVYFELYVRTVECVGVTWIDLNVNATIWEVKSNLLEGITSSGPLTLMFDGLLLEDDATLVGLGVVDGDTVYVSDNVVDSFRGIEMNSRIAEEISVGLNVLLGEAEHGFDVIPEDKEKEKETLSIPGCCATCIYCIRELYLFKDRFNEAFLNNPHLVKNMPNFTEIVIGKEADKKTLVTMMLFKVMKAIRRSHNMKHWELFQEKITVSRLMKYLGDLLKLTHLQAMNFKLTHIIPCMIVSKRKKNELKRRLAEEREHLLTHKQNVEDLIDQKAVEMKNVILLIDKSRDEKGRKMKAVAQVEKDMSELETRIKELNLEKRDLLGACDREDDNIQKYECKRLKLEGYIENELKKNKEREMDIEVTIQDLETKLNDIKISEDDSQNQVSRNRAQPVELNKLVKKKKSLNVLYVWR